MIKTLSLIFIGSYFTVSLSTHAQTPPTPSPGTAKPAVSAPAAPTTAPAQQQQQNQSVTKKGIEYIKIQNPSVSADELKAKSKGRYDVWFSKDLKTNFQYPYKKSFMSWVRLYDINRSKVPMCKKNFQELCGKEDFPAAEKFIFCLQDKYDKIKVDADCGILAHYLIHVNYYRHLALNTEPCKAIFDKCASNPSSTLAPWECARSDKGTTPLCHKLLTDFASFRVFASKLYDPGFICPPTGCK